MPLRISVFKDGLAVGVIATAIAIEQAGGLSGRDTSLLVDYAPTDLDGYRTQATACVLTATEASPGVVN